MTLQPYAATSDATTFWSEYPSLLTAAWSDLSDTDQLAYLVMATKEIDRLRFQGYKLYATQEHEFPRKHQIDPISISPWGILFIYLDPFGYWYEPTSISTPFYPSGYWQVGQSYVNGATVFDQATNAIYQCKLSHTSTALDEPGVGVNYATYWTLINGWPKAITDACILEAKALFEFWGDDELTERAKLKQAGVSSNRQGDVSETYTPGSRWFDEGLHSSEAYQLIEKYIEKSTNII